MSKTQDFNVVLVHGGFVDGAGWAGRLQAAPQGRLQSLDRAEPDHVARRRCRRDEAGARCARQAGHSRRPLLWRRRHHAKRAITRRSSGSSTSPRSRRTRASPSAKLIANPPPGAPVPPILPPQDGFLFLDKEKFRDSFAADVEADEAQFMADSQVPWGVNALGGEVTKPAWAKKPSFYLVATEDRMIPPDAQRFMSKRAGSKVVEKRGSHAIYVSQAESRRRLDRASQRKN